jgi:hypothetical protein
MSAPLFWRGHPDQHNRWRNRLAGPDFMIEIEVVAVVNS